MIMIHSKFLKFILASFLVAVGMFSYLPTNAKPIKPTKPTTPKKDDCPSGIKSEYGQCWTCIKASRTPVRQRVEIAKDKTSVLGKCTAGMNSNQLAERKQWWNELYQARYSENKCWTPVHQPHIDRATEDKKVSDKCNELLQPKAPKK